MWGSITEGFPARVLTMIWSVLKRLVWLLCGKSTRWWAGVEVGIAEISLCNGSMEEGRSKEVARVMEVGGLEVWEKWPVQNSYCWLYTIKWNRVSRQFWWQRIYSDARLPLKLWGGQQGWRGKSLKWNTVEINGPN